MKWKKTVVLCFSLLLAAGGMCGCNSEQTAQSDGKVSLSIGDWPYETQTAELEKYAKYLDTMSTLHPDITILPDTYHYNVKTFTMKASANQLPNLYLAYYTEFSKIVKAGYAADLTEIMEKNGLTKAINPELLNLVIDDNGRIRAVPTYAYAQGLCINKELFRQAGLVNADGSIKIPDTYEQMAEYAGIIKEKTGKAGYTIPTINNAGGWHFMNIAWSHGVKFMEQNSDGTWTAAFDSPEAVKALQYVKDLKWKYNALADNSVIDLDEMKKLFGTGQLAMAFVPEPSDITKEYGFDVKNIVMSKLPKGDAGRFTQMGGSLVFFSPRTTTEQIEAGFKWLSVTGFTPQFDEVAATNLDDRYKSRTEQNWVITGKSALPVWVDEQRVKKEEQVASSYINVDIKDFESYLDFGDTTLRAEEPMNCQELYAVLDGVIQEVVTNQNADPAALIKEAAISFQKNHLDKE